MKKLLIILLLLPVVAAAQNHGPSWLLITQSQRPVMQPQYPLVGSGIEAWIPIPGYTKINSRYEWIAGAFDSGLHVPQYNGTPVGIRSGVWTADGAIAVDTLNNKFYFYSGGSWREASGAVSLEEVMVRGDSTSRLIEYLINLNGSMTNFSVPNKKYVDSLIATVGGGTFYNSNVGSGFRLAIPNTNNIKTLGANYGILLDSITSNQIGIKLDTGVVFPQIRSTITSGGTPAGEFGDIQLNRNDFFASATDSFNYLTSSGLTVKNDGTFWGTGKFGTTGVVFNEDTVTASGYLLNSNTDFSGAAVGLGAGATNDTLSFLNYYHYMGIRGNGTLTKVFLYINSMPTTFFYIQVWRRVGSNYNLVYQENVISQLSSSCLCTINLTTPPQVEEGDLFGISYKQGAGGASTYVTATAGSVTGIYYQQTGAIPSGTGYNWGAKSSVNFFYPMRGYTIAPNLLFTGNSIAAGALSNSTYVEVAQNNDHTVTYAYKAATTLGLTYQNVAIGGSLTGEILSRFTQDVAAAKPRIAIYEGGVNDINIHYASAWVIQNGKDFIDSCISRDITPAYVHILPWTNGSDSQHVRIDAINLAIEAYCLSRGGICIDASQAVGKFRTGGTAGNRWDIQTSPDYDDDGVHYTALGYTAIADVVADSLALHLAPTSAVTVTAEDEAGVVHANPGNPLELRSTNSTETIYSKINLAPTGEIKLDVSTGDVLIPTLDASDDTTTYKPTAINSAGKVVKRTNWNVGLGYSGLASNRLVYANGASSVTSDDDFTVDATNQVAKFYTSNSVGLTIIGKLASGYGGLWMGESSFDGNNYFLSGNNTSKFLNVPNGQIMYIRQNNITIGQIETGQFMFGAAGTAVTSNTATTFYPPGNTGIAAAFKGAASQSGNLVEFRNSSNTILSAFDANGWLRLGGSTAHSYFQNTGSFALKYTAMPEGLTLDETHCVVEVTATAQTVTLPTAVGVSGRIYTIKLTASGSGTVATTSSQTIDGSTTYSLASQYKYVTVMSNGANWIVIANN